MLLCAMPVMSALCVEQSEQRDVWGSSPWIQRHCDCACNRQRLSVEWALLSSMIFSQML
ncbi:hypothetical protein BD289DRAFT_443474 [Coniella lustricola]|uniref:Uncharacterized protein n=1 Tax=Coniella lustricola TaxID=2025994 RepID=A0A2T2ZX49_9PEZI|nr:hypothetical protein BD289DRAFT_443474 [Coniella lustricola]